MNAKSSKTNCFIKNYKMLFPSKPHCKHTIDWHQTTCHPCKIFWKPPSKSSMHLKMNHREINRTSGLQVWQAFRLIRRVEEIRNLNWISRKSHDCYSLRPRRVRNFKIQISEISVVFNVMKIAHSFCAPFQKKTSTRRGSSTQQHRLQTDLKIWVSRKYHPWPNWKLCFGW